MPPPTARAQDPVRSRGAPALAQAGTQSHGRAMERLLTPLDVRITWKSLGPDAALGRVGGQ
jgi:hypothetical protein